MTNVHKLLCVNDELIKNIPNERLGATKRIQVNAFPKSTGDTQTRLKLKFKKINKRNKNHVFHNRHKALWSDQDLFAVLTINLCADCRSATWQTHNTTITKNIKTSTRFVMSFFYDPSARSLGQA